jgi:Flp pilus assembly protein TadG
MLDSRHRIGQFIHMTTTRHHPYATRRGVTLVEMAIVIGILLTMVGSGFYIGAKIGDWRRGRNAAEALRTVYAAQRMYLADHPTTPVNSLTSALLIPYLPAGATEMPKVVSLDDNELPILVTVSPPVVDDGGGKPYDPSGKSNDGLWDIGK